MGRKVIKKPLKQSQCEGVRDAFAKALYANMYTCIVRRLNLTINPDPKYK